MGEHESAVRDLIRRAAMIATDHVDEWIGEVDDAALTGTSTALIGVDPELRQASRRSSRSNIEAWIRANVVAPGEPVAPNDTPEMLEDARNMVRRGLESVAIDAYRAGQAAAWLRWMEIVFALEPPLEVARDALTVTARTIADFVGATVEAVQGEVAREREDLMRGANAVRRETLDAMLAGRPLSESRAEERLGHRLSGQHCAAVLWTEQLDVATGVLQEAASTLAARWGAGASLVVTASNGTVWLWVDRAPAPVAGRDLPDGVRVALGALRHGMDGFVASHLEAVTAQRMLARLRSERSVVTIDEVRLVNLVTADTAAADAYVRETLGALLDAPDDVRETLRVHLHAGRGVAATAERVHAHRNTVLRRVERARALLPSPAPSDVDVAVALDVARWHLPA